LNATLQMPAARLRAGLKGPQAAEWLAQRGLRLPAAANSWLTQAVGTNGDDELLVARLGHAEFFLESSVQAGVPARIAGELEASRAPGVYPVLREDVSFLLGGPDVHALLAQVCNVNFAAMDLGARPLVMTLLVGVAVLVVPRSIAGQREYQLWCDPSFGSYLLETFETVISDPGVIRGESGEIRAESGEAGGETA
jgi:sarcosine oxidase subunit gamma